MDTTSDIDSALEDSIHKTLCTANLTIIDTNPSKTNPNGYELFSGTLLAIEEKYFILTAGHCISPLVSNPEYWILRQEILHETEGKVTAKRWCIYPNNSPDIGYIELDSDSISKDLKDKSITLDQILPIHSAYSEKSLPCYLIGNPVELVDKELASSKKIIRAQVNSFTVDTIPLSEWPKLNLREDCDLPDVDRDFLVSYPEETFIKIDGARQKARRSHPKGLSGGGLWLLTKSYSNENVWLIKDNLKLIAIQSSFFSNNRIIRLVKIQYFLWLLHKHEENLRPVIERNFPNMLFAPTESAKSEEVAAELKSELDPSITPS